jgi:predicted site-specific integrase-resolvase
MELERAPMSAHHLNQAQLAERWGISPRTLERWRWRGEGPRFLKLGGRVTYRLSDIELFEQKRLRESTSDNQSDR